MQRKKRATSAKPGPDRLLSSQGLSYELHGQGPLCFTLHGGPGMSSGLWPALRGLSRRACVVTYDHRGHGLSQGPLPLVEPLKAMANDAAALIGELGGRPVSVLGHSNGSFVALHLALMYPDLVKRLVLVGTSASGHVRAVAMNHDTTAAAPSTMRALHRLWTDQLPDDAGFARAWRAVQPLYFMSPSRDRINTVLAPLRFDLEARRRILRSYGQYDLRSRLSEIHTPTLVIVGKHDRITPPRFASEVAQGIPAARLVIFKRSGHYPFAEEPRRFTRLVSDFLDAAA